MKTRTVLIGFAMVLLVAVSGCAVSKPAGQPAQESSASDSTHGVVFNLFTHCGIKWARIRGTFWRAEHELSDGNGNPPDGWGDPYQVGRLSFRLRHTATFRSTAGLVVFHRTSQSEPPFVCS